MLQYTVMARDKLERIEIFGWTILVITAAVLAFALWHLS